MKFGFLCKRYYTHKDLLKDKFGRLYHLPERLGTAGHKGVVIAADYRSSLQDTLNIQEVKFISIPLSVIRLIPFIRKCYNLFAKFEPDILIGGGDSYLGFIAMKIAHRLRIPFAFDVMDNYSAYASGRIPGMRSIYHYTLRHADLVITNGKSLQYHLNSFNRNSIVIENGTDPGLFHPIPKEHARKQLKLPEDERIIGFFGSIEPYRGVENLIKAIELLNEETGNYRLLLAGPNYLKLKFNTSWIDYRGHQPQEEIPNFINACDVVIIPYLYEKQVDVSNACKIAEYIACGIPVVATRVSDQVQIFSQAPQSLCDPGDWHGMAKAIQCQMNNPQIAPFPDYLIWENLAKKLADSLIKLTTNYNKNFK